MSIAEKLTAAAENVPLVFAAGRQAEHDAFWDVFQKGGGAGNYCYAFSLGRFNGDTYNPKYDIICTSSTNASQYLFFSQSRITDTKVAIYANSISANYCFGSARALKTIRLFSVYETTVLSNTFASCEALENLTMAGTVGQNIDLHWSTLLSKASIESVCGCLSDTSDGMTASFSLTAVNNAYETESGAADGSESEEWAALVAAKPNWTFSLS